jgi:hypothetical protein
MVHKRRFAVVDVGDNGDIAQRFVSDLLAHEGLSLKKRSDAAASP